ncbi:hypothetical protein [Streptomyces sp. S465]|nr:hypothetical protein [Streptomyces sp. S465]WAP53728.1 hypothetical protein N6H00_01485 [Streptomyces sp. S465]
MPATPARRCTTENTSAPSTTRKTKAAIATSSANTGQADRTAS